jgi:hypothetical protein
MSVPDIVSDLHPMPANLLELAFKVSSRGALPAPETAFVESNVQEYPIEVVREAIYQYIASHSKDVDNYDDWIEVGMRLNKQTGGAAQGLKEWDDWSRTGKKYKGLDDLETHWNSFSSEPGKRTVGMDALIRQLPAKAEEFDIIDGAEDAKVRPRAPILNAVAAAIGADTFRTPPAAPEFLIPELLPLEIGGLFAAGGMSKTTLMLIVAIHIILCRLLWGFPISRHGGVLMLSAEDGIERMRHRLYKIGQALGLTDDEIEKAGAGLLVEDLTGRNARLVEADQHGNLTQTRFVDEVINTYKDTGLVLVVIDPTVYFGPGERYVNDGEAAVAQVAARFRREMGCAVALVHHVGKANARAGASDQYIGRGGSALSDGLRWVWTLVTHTKDDGEFKAPNSIPADAIREGRVLRLHVAKLTDAPRPADPIWLVRTGFSFDRVIPQMDAPEDRRKIGIQRICGFVREQLNQGIRYSARSLEDESKRLGIGRNDLRSLVREALQVGTLVYRDLPEAEQRGGLKQFLDPGDESVDDLNVGAEGAE